MTGLGIRTDLAPSAIPPAPALGSAGDRSVLLARIGAVGIDLAICYFLLEVPVLHLLALLSPSSIDEWGALAVGLSIALLVPLYLTYAFYFEWRYGRTPGKVNRELLVVMENGRPCTLRASALRNLCRYVDFLGVPPLVVGVLAAIVSPTGKRLGDHIAGTLVVRARAPETDSSLPGFETDPGE